jgi:hypothetical protein
VRHGGRGERGAGRRPAVPALRRVRARRGLHRPSSKQQS